MSLVELLIVIAVLEVDRMDLSTRIGGRRTRKSFTGVERQVKRRQNSNQDETTNDHRAEEAES